MRANKALLVGMISATSTVALALDKLPVNLMSSAKVEDLCKIFKCTNYEMSLSHVSGKRPPILTCYCGSRKPILIQIISDLSQISSADRGKNVIQLDSKSIIAGVSAKYMLTDDAEFANFLNRREFSYETLSGNKINIIPMNPVSR